MFKNNKKIQKNFRFATFIISVAIIFFVIFSVGSITGSAFVMAQSGPTGGNDYVPLSPLPNTTNPDGTTDLTTYVKGMFALLIGGAAALAVIRIVIGGFLYMSTDAINEKSEGKEIIKEALYGLLLAISCWLILYTINPNILNFDVLNRVPEAPSSSNSIPGGGWNGVGEHYEVPTTPGWYLKNRYQCEERDPVEVTSYYGPLTQSECDARLERETPPPTMCYTTVPPVPLTTSELGCIEIQ